MQALAGLIALQGTLAPLVVRSEQLDARRDRRPRVPEPPAQTPDIPDQVADRIQHAQRLADLAAIKPNDRRTLYLIGLGYRYTEIMHITGASYTAVNRHSPKDGARSASSSTSARDPPCPTSRSRTRHATAAVNTRRATSLDRERPSALHAVASEQAQSPPAGNEQACCSGHETAALKVAVRARLYGRPTGTGAFSENAVGQAVCGR